MLAVDDRLAETNFDSATSLPPRKVNKVAVTTVLLTICTMLAGAIWWYYAHGREETDDAYVDGHITYISSRISGTVTLVLVDEHQSVKKEQLLILLDPRDQQTKVDEEKASLDEAQYQAVAAQSKIGQSSFSAQGQTAQATGDINSGQAGIAAARQSVLQARDQIRQAKARLRELVAQEAYARTDFERYKTVFEDRAVTRQQYDKAQQSLQVATAQREQSEENLRQCQKLELQAQSRVEGALAQLDKSKGTLTSAKATVAQGRIDEQQYQAMLASMQRHKAALSQAQLQLSYAQISAPVDGRIGKKSVEIGQRVEPGQTLMSVVQNEFWIMANFKETQVGKMHVGQVAEIKIDTFPDHTFRGRVSSLSPASGAKFSMLPPDNATGNFTKIVQRIPVKIVFDKQTLGTYPTQIAPGMSCLVTVIVNK